MKARLMCMVLLGTMAEAQNVTVQVSGRTVGTRPVLNLMPSLGVLETCSDNPANNRIDCAPSFNSVLVPTHDTVHSNENYCASKNGTAQYTCRLPYKSLTGYSAGMAFLLLPDVTCAGGCTLNVDNLGIVSIKRSDGTTDPRGSLVAGEPQWIFYDGKVFRQVGGGDAREGREDNDARNDVRGRRVFGSMETVPYSKNIRLDVTAGDMHKTVTIPAIGNAAIDAATGGLPGQHMWVLVTNDSAAPRTITFGGNLKSAGVLSGTPGKSSTLEFISDGMAWYEVSRTANL